MNSEAQPAEYPVPAQEAQDMVIGSINRGALAGVGGYVTRRESQPAAARLAWRIQFLTQANEAIRGCQREHLSAAERAALSAFVYAAGQTIVALSQPGGDLEKEMAAK